MATHKKVLELEKVKTDSNHVPTSVDAYTVGSLKESFDDRDLATDLQLALNKNRLASMGSNFCDHTKLGFKDTAALEKAHKAIDLKYLRQTNRMAVRIFHDAVFEHPTKETAARTKLHSILQNNEVSKILRGAVDDADDEWIAQPWRIPAVQIWGKICHKYEGMTDMLTGTMMEELANIITCVTGNARQRRTIYEADQDFERFGKTLIANFKDTAKADEYLTNLMDSDTMLTLENTNDAIKRAENYMQRQDTDGDKRVAFSSAVDDSTDGPDEVNTLRAKVLALEAKLDSFSHEQKDGGNKRKKPARKNEKECTYCKKAGKWFQGHEESECHHKKKDEAEAALQAIKEKRERTGKGRQATQSEKKAFAAGSRSSGGGW